MKKYYLHDGELHQGPFSIEELKTNSIHHTTPVWYEGLAEWTEAGSLYELKELVTVPIPPPFKHPTQQSPPPVAHHGSVQQHVQVNVPLQPSYRKWSPGIAALLSFFIPGVGQMYKGNILAGILWLLFVPVGYFLFIVPGLILHLICIITAASGDPYK